MGFTIGLSIKPQADPSELLLTDNSSATGGETVTSAQVVITLTNSTSIISTPYPFTGPFTLGVFFQLLSILDKDYSVDLVYEVITSVTSYSQEYQFVTLGYANLLKKNREFVLMNDASIQDQENFKKETLDINYYRMVAKDRCRFSDLLGAQQALDFIADMNLNSVFTLCPSGYVPPVSSPSS